MSDELNETTGELLARLQSSAKGHGPAKASDSPHAAKWNELSWSMKSMIHRILPAAGTASEPMLDEALPHRIQLPSVMMLQGSRGSGKTALGFRILELFEHHSSEKYVVGLPKSARSLLPKWIKIIDSIFLLPDNVTALIDEAHLSLHPRMPEADRRELSSHLALSRQRNQNFIFVSQQARTVSREIVSAADVLLFKNAREHQIGFDRPEFTAALTQAAEALKTVPGDRRPYTYVNSPDDNLNHLMKSEMPGFWSEKLSRIYSSQSPPKSLSEEADERRRRLIQMAKLMREQGFSIGAIRKRLGVGHGTAWNYVNKY